MKMKVMALFIICILFGIVTFLILDLDGDGLTGTTELQLGTNPLNSDSDGDHLNDGHEVLIYHTNPNQKDTDSDELTDDQEVFNLKTSPLDPDSDDDELNDGVEVKTYGTNPLVADTDGDGLKDGIEVNGWAITVNGYSQHVTSNPLSSDSEGDDLSDWDEYSTYYSNPKSNDTDDDGLPDRFEATYSYYFKLTDSADSYKDPDYDGLTNFQEYQLGTITRDGTLSFRKDLFVEIDYMTGYGPSEIVISYFISYYSTLNIDVYVTIDDDVSGNMLTAIGVSPDSLSPYECSLIENNFHDNPATHVYVFYAKKFQDPNTGIEPLGWAWEFGAFIHKEAVNSMEGIRVLWLTDRIRAEKVVLLHEVGHTLNVIITTSEGEEDYCSNLGCIMAGADSWYDIVGSIAQLVVFTKNNPTYCDAHLALIDLRDKWSVDESWK